MLRKRRLVFIPVILLAVLGVGVYLIQPKTVIQSQLSERALDYIGKKEGEFENVNLTPKVANINSKVEVSGCYSFVFPFDMTTTREQEECSWIYNFSDPIGKVVVRLKEVSANSLLDVPDVRLREDRDEIYKKSVESINGDEYYIFEKTTDGYELSAFSLSNGKVLSVGLTSQINRGLMGEFLLLLQSIQIY